MTVNSSCFVLFFALFLALVSGDNVCSYPYICLTTSECVEKHSVRGTEEVLFHCAEGAKVCCPPVKLSCNSYCGEKNFNKHHTTEHSIDVDYTLNPYQPNRPNFSESSTKAPGERRPDIIAVGHHVHGTQSPTEPKQPPFRPQVSKQPPFQPTEPKQPSFQPMEPKRPSYQPTEPKQPSFEPTEPKRPSYQPTEPKQSSFQPPESRRPPVQKPQKFPQPPQNFQAPSTQTKRPPQTSPSPTQRPANSKLPSPNPIQNSKFQLTSHRNFRLLPNESNCGVNNFANRITEGEEVSLGEYPWMVLTGLKDKYGNYRWNCGGTLINERYVLTAAHCLIVDNRTIEYVRLGEHSLTNETDCFRETCLDPPEDIEIAEVIPHENWNTTTIKNDIALLRLSRNPLILGKSNIYPICLPVDTEKLNITSNTKYEVAGWGKTDWNADEGSDVLRKASLSGMNREECNICKDKKKQQYCPIIDTQLCVQGWKSVDVCKGDSGGPLMVTRLNIYQIGITSFKGSEYCGAENIPSIFTKVESFLPWILDNIRK